MKFKVKKKYLIISFIVISIFIFLTGLYLFFINSNKALKSEEQAKTKLKQSSEVIESEETVLANVNTNLITLAIENTMLDKPFSPEITNYKAEVSNETDSLNILAISEDENSKVEIEKPEMLNIGNNLVKIIVTAKDRYYYKNI